MEKFSFVNHLYEITKLVVEMPTNFSEAWDRFRADVKSGKANDYNTGDILKDFNFKSAGEKWNAMTEAEQHAAIDDWNALMCNENGAYKRGFTLALVEAYKAGELDA